MWGWKFLKSSLPIKQAFIGFGIAFQPYVQLQWMPDAPDFDAAFISLGSESEEEWEKIKSTSTLAMLGEGWRFEGKAFGACLVRPLQEMLSPPEEFANKMNSWIDSKRGSIERCVQKLR
jgi:hypothetical protein